jgi:hypothetical protein
MTARPDWKDAVWGQFGAAIDSLEAAIDACPDALWGDRSRFPEYWYVVYHTLFFLDYYESESPEGYAPPAPFTLSELDPAGVLPDRVYSKEEMRRFLEHDRQKVRARIAGMSDDRAASHSPFRDLRELEFQLYQMRHVQHHAAQLNLILRQVTSSDAPRWIGRTKLPLILES